MIDEARIVAAGATVDDDGPVDDEQKRVAVVARLMPIAPIGLPMRHAIAEILDDARPFADSAQREHAPAVQPRASYPDHVRTHFDARNAPRFLRLLRPAPVSLAAFRAHSRWNCTGRASLTCVPWSRPYLAIGAGIWGCGS